MKELILKIRLKYSFSKKGVKKGVKSCFVDLTPFLFLLLLVLGSSCAVLEITDFSRLYHSVMDLHVEGPVVYDASPFGKLIRATSYTRKAQDKIEGMPHYINILDTGDEALLARIHLIRAAQKAIYVQTFIWCNDESGRYVIQELINAAQRGVKVKVIVDKLGMADDPDLIAYFADAHPNIELKFYNPSTDQISPSALHVVGEIVFKFKKINQRMHNKIMVFDDRIAITGGRNFENDYFDRGRTRNFKDRDVLVVGPVVQAMTESFMKYWAFKLSIPARDFVDVARSIENKSYEKRMGEELFSFGGLFADVDQKADDAGYIDTHFVKRAFKVNKVMFMADEPGKNTSYGLGGGGKAFEQLLEILSQAKKKILFQTPYLVLDKPAVKAIKKIRKKSPDLDICISTNSLAATDKVSAYSYAFKQKKMFLKKLRFRIFEFKPVPADIGSMMPNYDQGQMGPFPLKDEGIVNDILKELPLFSERRYMCVHAKSFVVDDEIAWIGSFNLDPRSFHLNTEVGLVIWDTRVAKALTDNMERDMASRNSWTVARRKEVPFVSFFSGMIGSLMELFPVGDVWPFQYTSLYELKENEEHVPFYHKDFYRRYRNVGSFPGVGLSTRQIQLRLLKALTGFAKPLI